MCKVLFLPSCYLFAFSLNRAVVSTWKLCQNGDDGGRKAKQSKATKKHQEIEGFFLVLFSEIKLPSAQADELKPFDAYIRVYMCSGVHTKHSIAATMLKIRAERCQTNKQTNKQRTKNQREKKITYTIHQYRGYGKR